MLDVPIEINRYDIVASYDFGEDLQIAEQNPDVVTVIEKNMLTAYSFESFDVIPFSIFYKDKEVYNSELSPDVQVIKLHDLADVKLENMLVKDSEVKIAFAKNNGMENLIKPTFLDIENAGTKTRIDFESSVTIERAEATTLNLMITPVYFEDLKVFPHFFSCKISST
jgi:hypothetical protein